MINTQAGNFVKFIRGTESSWAKIDNSLKSSDTLYFISNTGSSVGKLYLGEKLIANGGLTSATAISELNDVEIKAPLTDQSVLIYNLSTGKWENKSIVDLGIGNTAVPFVGASETDDGTSGLVPAPTAGQHILFLRGDGTWANPVAGLDTTVQGLQTQITTLVGEDTGKSVRDIASEQASSAVAEIVAQAPEQFDTLKEIADWIQANQDTVDVAGLTTRVSSLEDIIYGIPADEETGTEAVLGLQTVVSNMQTSFATLSETVENHTTQITNIENTLRWHDIIEE